MKRKTVGTGITARTELVPETEAEQQWAIERAGRYFESLAADKRSDFERVSARARASAEKTIAESDGEIQTIVIDGRTMDLVPRDSARDFAERISRSLELADIMISKGDADSAARFAFEAGVEWATAAMKFAWEKEALTGDAYRQKSEQGAAKRRGDFAEHTPEVLAEMARLIVSGQTVSGAARICAAKGLGASPVANRALWYGHRKKAVSNP